MTRLHGGWLPLTVLLAAAVVLVAPIVWTVAGTRGWPPTGTE